MKIEIEEETIKSLIGLLSQSIPTIKNQMKMEIAEQAMTSMIALLSQAIDILRNYDADEDANYIESEMEKTIQTYKENK